MLFRSVKESESESEVTQSCPTFCDPMDYSLPGFSIHGILQARVLEWGAIAFSETSPRDTNFKSESESHSVMSDGLFLTPRPSLPGSSVHGISQARIWSGLPFPSPGDLPDPAIETD